MKAAMVSLDGTANIDPSIALALLLKMFPYACGCSSGDAIAGCVENLY